MPLVCRTDGFARPARRRAPLFPPALKICASAYPELHEAASISSLQPILWQQTAHRERENRDRRCLLIPKSSAHTTATSPSRLRSASAVSSSCYSGAIRTASRFIPESPFGLTETEHDKF